MRQLSDRGVDQGAAAPFVELGGNDLTRRGDRDIDGDPTISARALASSWAIRSSARRWRRRSISSRSWADCAAKRSASVMAWAMIAAGLPRTFALPEPIRGE